MLPITKEQFLEGLVDFLNRYKRIPYLPEDRVLVAEKDENGNLVDKPYRANRYITEFYGNLKRLIDELFKLDVVSLELLSEMSGSSETIIQNVMTATTKIPDIRVRRSVEVILGVDYYKKELGSLNQSHCAKCTKSKQCGQSYYVEIVSCPKYKQRKTK